MSFEPDMEFPFQIQQSSVEEPLLAGIAAPPSLRWLRKEIYGVRGASGAFPRH